MKAVFLAVSFVTMATSMTRADVDTLECNTAVAVRVQYSVASNLGDDLWAEFHGRRQSGAFCLLLNGEAVKFNVNGREFSIQYDPRPRGSNELATRGSALGLTNSMTLAPDDLAGRVFYATPMVQKPYDPSTDGDWRYTPMWMEFGETIRISIGERVAGLET